MVQFLEFEIDESVRRDGIAHPDVDVFDLRVILQEPGVDKRVECAFEEIVEIAAAGIRRIEISGQHEPSGELGTRAAEARNAHHPIVPPLAAQEHARADMTVITVHAGRPRKFKLHACPHGAEVAAAFAL